MTKQNNGFVRIPRWAIGLISTIFIGLLTFAVVWGMFRNKVVENSENIQVLQKDVRDLKAMKTDVAVIRNDVSWIKEALVKNNAPKKQKR